MRAARARLGSDVTSEKGLPMPETHEHWYQAAIRLRSRDVPLRSKYVVVGPPRRLAADIKLDLARRAEAAEAEWSQSQDWKEAERGALQLWPVPPVGTWITASILDTAAA